MTDGCTPGDPAEGKNASTTVAPHDGRRWSAGDPAFDLAAAWILLPDGAADRFHDAYQPSLDAATLRRARGWAVLRAFSGIFIGDAGVHGRPGDKPT
jgi:hypothetical protein